MSNVPDWSREPSSSAAMFSSPGECDVNACVKLKSARYSTNPSTLVVVFKGCASTVWTTIAVCTSVSSIGNCVLPVTISYSR